MGHLNFFPLLIYVSFNIVTFSSTHLILMQLESILIKVHLVSIIIRGKPLECVLIIYTK